MTKSAVALITATLTLATGLAASTGGVASGALVRETAALEATSLVLTASPKVLGPGDVVTLRARLTRQADDQALSGKAVTIQWKRGGTSNWRDVQSLTTGHRGLVRWEETPRFSGQFRAVFAGDPTDAGSRSTLQPVKFRPAIRTTLSKSWVRPTGSVKLGGRVYPSYRDERVSLQRRVDSGWHTIARTKQGGKGGFAFRVDGTNRRGPEKYRAKVEGRGKHLAAVTHAKKLTTVRVVTYRVETRGRIVVDMKKFRDRAQAIYNDRRGWSRAYVHFKRVRSGGAFSLVLSQASYVPSFAPICSAYWSCRAGRYVVINQNRWRWGTPYFKHAGGNLREYRAMVVNHETGHWFGLGHASCGKAGARAPVMMQQSKGLNGCKPNPWPLPGEISRVR